MQVNRKTREVGSEQTSREKKKKATIAEELMKRNRETGKKER